MAAHYLIDETAYQFIHRPHALPDQSRAGYEARRAMAYSLCAPRAKHKCSVGQMPRHYHENYGNVSVNYGDNSYRGDYAPSLTRSFRIFTFD